MLRVGLAGVSHIHIADAVRVLRARDDVDVVGVCDRNQERAERVARQLAAPHLGAFDDLVDRGADGCLIYGRTTEHKSLVKAAARAGMAIFVEKPLAAEPEEAREVAQLLDERAQVGLFLRYCPAICELARRVAAGEIGRIESIALVFVHDGLRAKWFDGDHRWMADSREGGGGFFDLAVHGLDVLTWIAGAVERTEHVELHGPHHGEAVFHHVSGTRGALTAGWQAPRPRIAIDVIGQRGSARLEGGRLSLGDTVVLDGEPPGAESALEVWLDHLCGRDAPPLVRVADALRNAEQIHALRDFQQRRSG